MSFLEKYLILSKLDVAETMSFRAQDVSSGQSVLLHQLLPGETSSTQPDLMSMVYKYLPGDGTRGTEHYLDSGQEEDRIYIVTSDVPECVDVRVWLQGIATALGDIAVPSAPPQGEPELAEGFAGLGPENALGGGPERAEAQSEPGEFTRMFGTPSGKAKPAPKPVRGQVPAGFEVVYQSQRTASRAGSAPAALSTPSPQAPAEETGPGEFTGMFSGVEQGKVGQPPAPQAPGKPLSEAPPLSDKAAPGEFTGMFAGVGKAQAESPPPTAPSAPAPRVASAPPVAEKAAPGTFTQMFAKASPGKAEKAAPPMESVSDQPTVVVVAGPEKPAPGTFTQMFAGVGAAKADQFPAPPPPPSPAQPPAALPPKTEKSGPGEFAPMITGTSKGKVDQPLAATPPPGRAPSAAPPPPASSAQDGPGEFTLMFQAGTQAPPKSEPPLAGLRQGPVPPTAGARGLAQPPSASPGPPSGSGAPGEFTQMFKSGGEVTGARRASGVVGPSQAPVPPLPGAAKPGLGELTNLLKGYKPPAPTPVPVPPKPASPPPAATLGKQEPGEFTLLFQRPPQPTAQPAPTAAPPPPVAQTAPPSPQPRQAGEYTSMFDVRRVPPTPPATVPPGGSGYPVAPGAAPPPMPQMPAYQMPAPPAAPPVAYPQIATPQAPQYQAPPPPAYPVAPAPAMPQMQPMAVLPPPMPQPMQVGVKKPGKPLVVLLILGGLFLVAVGLIVFFALKH